jgi:hypothetical protein
VVKYQDKGITKTLLVIPLYLVNSVTTDDHFLSVGVVLKVKETDDIRLNDAQKKTLIVSNVIIASTCILAIIIAYNFVQKIMAPLESLNSKLLDILKILKNGLEGAEIR